jgi:hypothetical protein
MGRWRCPNWRTAVKRVAAHSFVSDAQLAVGVSAPMHRLRGRNQAKAEGRSLRQQKGTIESLWSPIAARRRTHYEGGDGATV